MKRARKGCGSGADDEAATRYQRGLAIVREQGARSVELRAATSPALVYEWFTEGFDTRRHVTSRS